MGEFVGEDAAYLLPICRSSPSVTATAALWICKLVAKALKLLAGHEVAARHRRVA